MLNPSFFYIRTKGEVERDILALNFEHTHLFRPSMLLGHREENRPMDSVRDREARCCGFTTCSDFTF